ncbi:YebC/PmpR family DNA-binding transcriptional regulator [Candidatus Peregrinibacteria bacterium CG11_big_fil_rev_8_21_14_0_20_46_8]|nr:MAG: YebC/PmpR family DNA-binding transcriptional regulator [Candidatus Peregrinibacteria bacterium CG11_big_fil_rev_8_21_14_0_20_46_8]
MARHSHWHQIRFKKGIADKKRGKVFTKHARLIEIAARSGGGGDPDKNPTLRLAIDNAKADNVPNDNIERAIKKGTGELKEDEVMHEVVYEGYAPGGVALVIETLTENKNRTSQHVRTILTKGGGNFGEAGSTTFMFDKKAQLRVALREGSDRESDELECIDAGADDIQDGAEGELVVFGGAGDLGKIRGALQEKGFAVRGAELVYVPKNEVDVEDVETARKIMTLIDTLDELDDVLNVATNMGLSDEVAGELG